MGHRGGLEYFSYPISSAFLAKIKSDGKEIDPITLKRELDRLAELLTNQTSDTIDDFIVENEDFAKLTKICIATVFLNKLYTRTTESSSAQLSDLARRNFSTLVRKATATQRNWIHHFINLVRKAVRDGVVTPENKVRVISFNYDNILEFVLDEQFRNSGYGYEPWENYIEILHPHGQCGRLQKQIDNPAAVACEWAEGIFVVNEHEDGVSEGVKADRLKAKKWIDEAAEIYAMGFAFSGPNLKLLGLKFQNKPKNLKLMSFCNYDGNIGLSRIVKRFEMGMRAKPINSRTTLSGSNGRVIEVQDASGTSERPMNCSDWFKLGYPGEPPS